MKIYLSGSLGREREKVIRDAGMRYRLAMFIDTGTQRDLAEAYPELATLVPATKTA
jgi:hypothetical protein